MVAATLTLDSRTAVPSFTRPGVTYRTNLSACSCPDHQYRGRVCKHMTALREQRATALCTACGTDRDELDRLAAHGGRMDRKQLACWARRCGR